MNSPAMMDGGSCAHCGQPLSIPCHDDCKKTARSLEDRQLNSTQHDAGSNPAGSATNLTQDDRQHIADLTDALWTRGEEVVALNSELRLAISARDYANDMLDKARKQPDEPAGEPVAWMFPRRYGFGLSFVRPADYFDHEDQVTVKADPLYRHSPSQASPLLAATQTVYVREHLHRDKLLEAARELEQHYGLHGPENTGFRNRMDNLRAAIKWQPETKAGSES